MDIYEGIMAGLEDALAYKRGEPNGVIVRVRGNGKTEDLDVTKVNVVI